MIVRSGKVVFTNPDAGYEDDREDAARLLKVGSTYTVTHADIGGWRTEYTLAEVPGHTFNSVLFDPA